MKTGRGAAALHRIGEGAIFEGELRFSGRLEVDGQVVGAVIAEPPEGSEVVVGPKGRIQGPVIAASVLVAGRIEGSIKAGIRLEVAAGARVRGEIVYRDLQVQHGAVLEGSLLPAEGGQVALKLVANSRN
ncbi:MAG: polymer-forming cytoskeletal protein [Lautropia sp.]